MTKPLRKCPNCAALFSKPAQVAIPRSSGRNTHCPLCLFKLPERKQQAPKGPQNRPRMQTGESVTGRRRRKRLAKLLARDGDRCWICRRKLGADMTEDHYIPRSKGGTNALSNLRLAHRRCNQNRGDTDPPDRT